MGSPLSFVEHLWDSFSEPSDQFGDPYPVSPFSDCYVGMLAVADITAENASALRQRT